MAIKQIQLIAPVLLTAVVAPYLTAPAGTTYRIGRAGFANPTAGAIQVTAYLVPQAGVAGPGNQILPPFNVPSSATFISPELAGLIVPPGYSVQSFAGIAASVIFYASGVSIQ